MNLNVLEKRVDKLETYLPQVCMAAIRYQDDSVINWNDVDYPDEDTLSDAVDNLGLKDRIIIISMNRNRF